tara:strand:+ start:233 stop:541 length:309 start_codon:yes stop_codon:yes gene_type:complete
MKSIEWAAGLFEGEGSITNCGIYPKLYLAMTDKDVVEEFMSIVGMGKIHVRDRTPHQTQYAWQVHGRQIRPLLERLLPFLGERRSYKALNSLDEIDNIYSIN